MKLPAHYCNQDQLYKGAYSALFAVAKSGDVTTAHVLCRSIATVLPAADRDIGHAVACAPERKMARLNFQWKELTSYAAAMCRRHRSIMLYFVHMGYQPSKRDAMVARQSWDRLAAAAASDDAHGSNIRII